MAPYIWVNIAYTKDVLPDSAKAFPDLMSTWDPTN